jgi:hypothetical protein
MTKQRRTRDEMKLWDAVAVALAPHCFQVKVENAADGCAHLVREIADAIIRERRKSVEQDR